MRSLIGCLLLCAAPSIADELSFVAVRDTHFTTSSSPISNGSGIYACVGQNGLPETGRALFRFDVGAIPPGSIVTGAALELGVVPNSNGEAADLDLHLLLEDWGEAGSDAPQGECQGALAQTGDATWSYRFYDSASGMGTPWSTPGGHFVAAASATTFVTNSPGIRSWSSAQLAAEVQGWVDGGDNFGWLLRRQVEAGISNSLRFRSRQNSIVAERPRLRVTFDPPSAFGACCTIGESCTEQSLGDCIAAGGIFQGGGSSCAATVCIDPVGACCADDTSCSETTELACAGTYQGNDTSCAEAQCPLRLEPFVDSLPLPAIAQPIGGTTYQIAMREVQQQMHRDLSPTTVWGYGDGASGASTPGPTIEATVDQPLTVEFVNDLRDTSSPADPKPLRTDHYLEVAGLGPPPECRVHGAEDAAKAVVHLHGGHVPAAFDGYPEDNYDPGQSLTFTYPNNQLPATLWYHDHALGITRLNVYMGLFGFYIIRDAFEQTLALPSGEYELPLAIHDKSFAADGTLLYPADIQDVFFGDFVLVNGKVWPYHEVKQGKYRLRLLNGSGSRTYTLSLSGTDRPFMQIGTDGGLLDFPVERETITLAPAERADVVVDFEGLPAGTEIVLTNSAPAPFPGNPGEGVVPDVMQFRVTAEPGDTADLPLALRPLETIPESESVKSRDFTLERQSDACGGIWKINDLKWDDITEYPQLGTTEIWRFINPSPVMHPMHMHLVFFQVLDRTPIGGGPPVPPDDNERGWKDTVRVDPDSITRVIARFTDYTGKYAYHCHILEHEDHEMMRQFRSVEAISMLMGSNGLLFWSAQWGAESYGLVRGDLSALVATDGDYAAATEACVATPGGTQRSDPTLPLPGEGFWYLVRSVDAGGFATYDCGKGSQVGMRDAEIASSGMDCP